MKPLLRGRLPLALATACLLLIVDPAAAQRRRPGGFPGTNPGGTNIGNPSGFNTGNPGGMNVGNPPGFNTGNPPGMPGVGGGPDAVVVMPPFGNPGTNPMNNPNTAAAASAASGVGTGMIIGGIFLIVAGLGLTGGIIYLGMQGQKTTYRGGARRRRKMRDLDD